jgi:ABC-type antimicrobial peptide transport system permease subunit
MQPNDPLAISGAALVLALAAFAAGYGPAWQASRIDPWNALRHE